MRRSSKIVTILPCQRQAKGKRRSPAQLALDLELFAVKLDDLAGERQPETGAPCTTGYDVAAAIEALAEVVEVGGRDPRAVVTDGHAGMPVADHRRGAHGHLRV